MLATLVREVCAISDSFWFKMAGIVDSEAHFESRAIEYGYDVKGFILLETSKELKKTKKIQKQKQSKKTIPQKNKRKKQKNKIKTIKNSKQNKQQ